MLSLQRGHHGDSGEHPQKRAIEFIRLRNQILTASQLGAGTQTSHLPAHDDGGIQASLAENQAHYRGGGGLAVGACDAHRELHSHEFTEHLGSSNDRDLAPSSLHHLWIILFDRRGDDHHIGLPDQRSTMTLIHPGPQLAESLGDLAKLQI